MLRRWRGGGQVNAERSVLERIERVAAVWRKMLRVSAQNGMVVPTDVGKLLAAAYPERIARQKDAGKESYRMANGRGARLSDGDPLIHDAWIAIAQMDAGGASVRSQEGRIFLAAPINPNDFSEYMHREEVVRLDYQRGELLARMETRLGEITVSSTALSPIPSESQIRVLEELLRKEGENLLPWTDSLNQWQARVMSLRAWRPDEDWPDMSRQHLLTTISEWLSPYLTSVRRRDDFTKLDLEAILAETLSWPQRQTLGELAPETLPVPSGSRIRIKYQLDGGLPVLAGRLQEMFGLADTPLVNGGRTRVLLHLLSPASRPVQVTQDLKSFWNNTYPEVRKDLRLRYPRHHWPEDPWTAEAVRGVKKRNL